MPKPVRDVTKCGENQFAPENAAEERVGNVVVPQAFGRVELRGVDYIPHRERQSGPSVVFWILGGGSLALSTAVVGTLPIAFGLSWKSSLSSIVVGTLVGAGLLALVSIFGPKTGTNNPVASGAHFGVVGRVIGSVLSLLGAVAFAALAVWTSGSALVGASARIVGTPDGDGALAVGYLIMVALVMVVAILGFRSLLILQRAFAPLVAFVMLLGVFAFGSRFDGGHPGTGTYLLGAHFPTWALAVSVFTATVLSYAPFVGDYTRYISLRSHRGRKVISATFCGAVVGQGASYVFGAFTATALVGSDVDWAHGLVAESPNWYLLPVLLVALLGAVAQGTACIYGTGLDFASLVPTLSRVQATLLFGTVTLVLVFVSAFIYDATEAISVFLVLLVVFVVPWALVLTIGFWHRRGVYFPDDLQVFNRRERGGRYWFTGGWNLRATSAWILGVFVGVMFTNTAFFAGPFANAANGVDVSFLVAGVVASAAYVLLLAAFPEPIDVFGPQGRRFLGKRLARCVAGAEGTSTLSKEEIK